MPSMKMTLVNTLLSTGESGLTVIYRDIKEYNFERKQNAICCVHTKYNALLNFSLF